MRGGQGPFEREILNFSGRGGLAVDELGLWLRSWDRAEANSASAAAAPGRKTAARWQYSRRSAGTASDMAVPFLFGRADGGHVRLVTPHILT
jgi:hypothetical protein